MLIVKLVFLYILSFCVYFVYLYSYLKHICVFPSFSSLPAAHCTPLLTSRHLPAKLSADRWELAAPFINELQSAWSHSPAPQFWQGPLNFGKVAVPKKTANLLFTKKREKTLSNLASANAQTFHCRINGVPNLYPLSEERQVTAMYYLKCVQNLRARSDVSKNGVNKSNWIKNDRHMEHWKFRTFTNPSSDGDTHIQWSIMFHSLS